MSILTKLPYSLALLATVRVHCRPGACPVRRRRRPVGSVRSDDGAICSMMEQFAPMMQRMTKQNWQEAHGSE